MRIAICLLVAGLAGCSAVLGIDDVSGPGGSDDDVSPGDDVPSPGDAPPVVSPTVIVRGRLLENSTAPLVAQPVRLVKMPGRVEVASTTTATDGTYTFTAPTGGVPLDAHVEVSPGGPRNSPPSIIHVGKVLDADITVRDVEIFGAAIIESRAQDGGDPRQAANAFVRVIVRHVDGTPAAGATIQIDPSAPVRYLADDLTTSRTATMTSGRGVGYVFNAKLGANTVAVAIEGLPLPSYSFPIFAGGEAHYVEMRR